MAAYRPPSNFIPGDNPAENWERWRQKYEIYKEAADIEEKTIKKQMADFLHAVGDEGLAIYNSLQLPKEENTLPSIVMDAITKYYTPYKNTTYIRWVFGSTNQIIGQSIDQYVMILKEKIRNCEYGELSDSLLRDRIIGGILDGEMRERLLKDHKMTLEKAINLIRANEGSKEQSKKMNSIEKQVDNIKRDSQAKCYRCGTNHTYRNCPAFGKICKKCGGRNHSEKVCKATTSQKQGNKHKELHAMIEDDSKEEEDAFELYSVSSKGCTEWKQEIETNGLTIMFKLDTGSEVNVINKNYYDRLEHKPELELAKVKISAYSGHPIDIIGKCKLTCKVKQLHKEYDFYVTTKQLTPILGIRACEELQLVKRLRAISTKDFKRTPKDIIENYKDVFQGVGKLKTQYEINVSSDAVPKICAARRIPLSLKGKVKIELQEMEKEGIIKRETEPTDWVHPIVLANKPNGRLRICLDPRPLNTYINRQHHPIPTVETILADIQEAKVFTVLDASSAFWQIPLTDKSSKLCTVATPFGRYRFLRLPYGIKSAPEVLQQEIDTLIDGIEGVRGYMDDIMIYGSTQEEHDSRLIEVLERARKLNFKFNKKKLQLSVPTIKYLGHQITPKGIEIHKAKVEAISSMKAPESKEELQRFLGMVTFLGRYIPNLSDETHYLRQLLCKDRAWTWEIEAKTSFEKLKKLITNAPTLIYFDSSKPTILSVDASQYGLGAVLLQGDRPIAYSSVSLTTAQKSYAQIEKELLAIVWGCEHFHLYLYGTSFTVQTDHLPLLGLVNKPLENVSPRLQRLLLRFMRYDPHLLHVPGKFMYVADTLSREPQPNRMVDTDYLHGEASAVHSLVSVSENRRDQLVRDTDEDEELKIVKEYIKNGWPHKKPRSLNYKANQYWHCRNELHEAEGLVFRSSRLIIPKNQRLATLKRIHQAHQGVNSCVRRAKQAIYWPTMSADITQVIQSCATCQQYARSNIREPLKPHEIVELPWKKVGVDFFKAEGRSYMIIADYHSKFIEVRELKTTTASSVISEMKMIFGSHGIPAVIMSDNGPPFDSNAIKDFFKDWDITHATSSPMYPRSNGFVERMVGTAKGLITKACKSGEDCALAIMAYNATPKEELKSPAEMLMGRPIRTILPVTEKQLAPHFDVSKSLKTMRDMQVKTKKVYDSKSQTLPPLSVDQPVFIQRGKRDWVPGKITEIEDTPRSYRVQTPEGSVFRRNRFHLRPENMQEKEDTSYPPEPENQQPDDNISNSEITPSPSTQRPEDREHSEAPVQTQKLENRTRSGRLVKIPTRFGD